MCYHFPIGDKLYSFSILIHNNYNIIIIILILLFKLGGRFIIKFINIELNGLIGRDRPYNSPAFNI